MRGGVRLSSPADRHHRDEVRETKIILEILRICGASSQGLDWGFPVRISVGFKL